MSKIVGLAWVIFIQIWNSNKERGRNPMNHLDRVMETAQEFVSTFKKEFPKMNDPQRLPQYERAKERLTRKWNQYDI